MGLEAFVSHNVPYLLYQFGTKYPFEMIKCRVGKVIIKNKLHALEDKFESKIVLRDAGNLMNTVGAIYKIYSDK